MEVDTVNWLSVEVKRGAKVLQPATVVAVTQEESFGSLLGRVFEQYHDDTVEKTVIASSSKGTAHTVPLCAPVLQVCLKFK